MDQGEKWTVARRQLEQIYSMEDALVVGGMLITLLSHADRVKIGCIAQVVNAIAPIMTAPGGPAWKQSIFFPFAAASRYGRGVVLQTIIQCPDYHTKVREDVPIVKAVSVVNEEGLTVFALNRDPSGEPITLTGSLRRFARARTVHHEVLCHANLKAANSAESPDTIAPRAAEQPPVFDDASFTAVLPPYSWNVIHFSL